MYIESGRPAVCRADGFSLIELVMFIAIVGAALAGVLSVLDITTQKSADPMLRKQMLAIAESLIDEISSRPFTFCAPTDANATTATSTAACTTVQAFGQPAAAGSDRSLYDNVGSYCGEAGPSNLTCGTLTLGTASSAASVIPDVTNLNGAPPGYWATVQLVAESLGGIASDSAAAANMEALRIRVTVFNIRSPENIVLETYRTRWAPRL